MSEQDQRAAQLDGLRRRAAHVRARAAVRKWEYRQRRLAKGVWDRLRGVLARAQTAHAVPEEVASFLIAEGLIPEPVGLELHPPKTLLFVTAKQLEHVAERRELAVRLGEDLLAARSVLLVAFDEE